MVARQRLVYKAIWDELSGPVHAVDAIIAKVRAQPHRTSSAICFLINPRC
jgi:stress-induced morphogen